jgi:hypothetical protein
MNDSAPSTLRSAAGRFLLRALFVLATAFLAFGAGSWAAARYIVAPGEGLAGPVEVLAYGALTALVAGILAIGGSRYLRGRALLATSLAVSICAAALLAYIVYDVARMREARRDPDGAYAGIRPFTAQRALPAQDHLSGYHCLTRPVSTCTKSESG